MRCDEIIEIEKACAFCERAVLLVGGEEMLCAEKGVVSVDYCCRKFVYDPLKRDPPKPPKLVIPPPEDMLP